MPTPSHLDSPRFFDDEPLSAWYTKDTSFATSRSAVHAKRLAYSAAPEIPRLPPTDAADPIAVELVRGANGPFDDEWTVLVDGIQCRKLPTQLQGGEDVFRCILPPGVTPPKADRPNAARLTKDRLTKDTRVRPVVFGVRLEAEARAPYNVKLDVEQVLKTSERLTQDPDEPETTLLKTVDLKPYRVSDLESSSAAFMYPFCAPAQSVLGILNMEAFKRYEEDNKLAALWNTAATVATAAREAAYNDQIISTPPVSLLRQAFESPTDLLLRELAKPKKPSAISLKSVPEPPKANSKKTVRIGGGSKSSPRELGELFKELLWACEYAKEVEEAESGENSDSGSEASNSSVSIKASQIQQRIQAMEMSLTGNRETKALALLRALCTTHVDKTLVDTLQTDQDIPKYNYRYEYDSETETFKRSLEQSSTPKPERNQTNAPNEIMPYEFTYSRLLSEERELTTVSIQFKITIVDKYDSVPFRVEFVALQRDAIVAHTVYSGLVADIEYMDEQASAFLECLFGPHVDRTGSIRLSTNKKRRSSPATLKAAMRRAAKDKIESILRKMTQNTAETDVVEIETRVAELRIMMQKTLPEWPFDVASVEDIEQSNSEAAAIVEAFLRSETEPSEETGIGAFPVEPIGVRSDTDKDEIEQKQLQDEALEAQDEARIQMKKQVELILEADRPDETSLVYVEGTQDLTLLRVMPQLVKTRKVMGFSFRMPEDTEPPNIVVPSVALGVPSTSRWQQFATAVAVVGVLFGAYVKILSLGRQLALAQAASLIGGRLTLLDAVLTGGNIVQFGSALKKTFRESIKANRKLVEYQLAALSLVQKTSSRVANIGRSIAIQSQYRIQNNEALNEAYQQHSKEVRGVPIEDSFAAANKAVREWTKRERLRLLELGAQTDTEFAYNTENGKRFRFVEWFANPKIVDSRPLYTNADWKYYKNSNALRIMSPADVDDAIFEAQELRAIPLAQTMAFVAGRQERTDAVLQWLATPANAAFGEIAKEVVDSLSSMHNGQRLQQSPSNVCLQIVTHISSLLRAVYGTSGAITLVPPGDILWSCFRGGSAARLAIRHLPLFLISPELSSTANGNEFLKASFKFWSAEHQVTVDRFAEALLVEAKAFETNGLKAHTNATRDVEAYRALNRINSLLIMKPDNVAKKIQNFVTDALSLNEISIDVLQEKYDFSYQREVPKTTKRTTVNSSAVWASRRVNTTLARSLQIGIGTNSVIDQLSSVDLYDKELVFYCPVGDNLLGLPSGVAFLQEHINQKMIWLTDVEEAGRQLINSLPTDNYSGDAWSLDAIPIHERKVNGPSRHPTTLQLKGKNVKVGLSNMASSPTNLSEHVVDMRRRAFNTDRLFCALSLWLHYKDTIDTLHVFLPQEDVVCMAIALAMIGADHTNSKIVLRVESYERALRDIETLVAQVKQASILGCRVVFLSELCMCV